jgi:hypothetical protein
MKFHDAVANYECICRLGRGALCRAIKMSVLEEEEKYIPPCK